MNSGSISSPRKTGQTISDEFIKHQKSHQLEMNEPLRMLIILPGKADSFLLNKYSSCILKHHIHRISPLFNRRWCTSQSWGLAPASFMEPTRNPAFVPLLPSSPVSRMQPLGVHLTANFSLSAKTHFPKIQKKCPPL